MRIKKTRISSNYLLNYNYENYTKSTFIAISLLPLTLLFFPIADLTGELDLDANRHGVAIPALSHQTADGKLRAINSGQ